MLLFSAVDVQAFIGLGKPDFDDPNWMDDDGLFGFAIDQLDLGLAVMESSACRDTSIAVIRWPESVNRYGGVPWRSGHL
ncbi:MAG UNVERIFIED_CONTAM: hypothetical protein LVR18_45875 [Planctomycetaceae bacterium]